MNFDEQEINLYICTHFKTFGEVAQVVRAQDS